MQTIKNLIEFFKLNTVLFFQNLIVAIIIIFIGFIIAKTVKKIAYSSLHEIELNKLLRKVRLRFNIEKVTSNALYYIIILITIIRSLQQLNLATTVLNIFIASAALLASFLAIVWLKYFIPNAFAGLILRKKIRFKEGDFIHINYMDLKGKVDKISASETKIITKNHDCIYIPNSSIYRSKITIKRA